MSDRLVWLDLETTGLIAVSNLVLEIACLVTEADLTPIDAGYSTVIHVDRWRLQQMPDPIWEMHSRSGLVDESVASTTTLYQAQTGALAYVAQHVPAGVVPCAGSSVRFDRGFLAVHTPILDGYLHYRIVDVSTVKELVRRWFPATYARLPKREPAHRAMPDVLASIAELKFYRAEAFSSPVPA